MKILGEDNSNFKLSCEFEEEIVGFGEEGIEVMVYNLPQEISKNFLLRDKRVLPDRDGWEHINWKKAQLTLYNEYDFVPIIGRVHEISSLDDMLNEIKVGINDNDIYYAYYAYPKIDHVLELEVFFLNEKTSVLYRVYYYL